jgi:cytochrome b6
VTGATLTRFYGIHVAVLPALVTLILGLHLYLVQKHGMSVPPSVERAGGPRRTMPFVPDFLLRDMVGWLSALAVLAALAAFLPAELGKKADPFAPAPIGIKPEWYFMFMFQTLKFIPAKVWIIDGELLGVAAFGVAGLVWLLLPFLDRGTTRSRLLINGLGIFALAYIMAMTLYGYLYG